MQASSSQPRYAPATHHVRRPSRPQSVLETLIERRDSEADFAVPRPPPAVTPRARPTSLVMSAPTQSHMPRSIFPDVPVSRRSSTTSASLATTPAPIYPNPVSRRHTTYLVPSPMAIPPRRDPRPLRSSPLAGPSLALSDDGTLTGSDESFEARRFKPNRISSTPDVTMSTLMKLEGRSVTSLSEPASPAGTFRNVARPAVELDQIAVERTADKGPPPPESVKKSATRRLSFGFKRLSSFSGSSKADASDKSDMASAKSLSSSRSRTFSMSSLKSNKSAAAPPVPSIPVWAQPSYMPKGVTPTSTPSSPVSEAQPIPRRPSTTPSNRSTSSINRRSAIYGSTEALPGPSSPPPTPSTSRDPEQNWMSTAAAPKFSRLGLKGDGVVLPLTAKEVRRRSTIRVPSSPTSPVDADARTLRSMRSGTSLRSLAASFQTIPDTDVPTPPTPPFRRATNTSSSSIASSAGSVGSCAESDFETPSLSRASSDSGVSVDPESPRTPGVDELGVVRHAKEDDEPVAGVELRVNDVTVEIIELREKERVRQTGVEVKVGVKPLPAPPSEGRTKGVPERKGTIKRVWRKLTGSTRR